MRVIGGVFRGRRLKSPEGISTRPTSDRVRESLFDVIAPRIKDARFLDAYAGTGAVGIEAISRGAKDVVFIEDARKALDSLETNLKMLGITDRVRVLRQPFDRSAIALGRESAPFDLIFLDPPYGHVEILKALRLVHATALLSARGLLVAEHDATLALPPEEGSLALTRTLRYGGTVLSLYTPVDRPERRP